METVNENGYLLCAIKNNDILNWEYKSNVIIDTIFLTLKKDQTTVFHLFFLFFWYAFTRI